MPAEFEELAAYNANAGKGVACTPEYAARMADLQAQFDAWNEWQMLREGFRPVELPSGGTAWIKQGEDPGHTSPAAPDVTPSS
jgi:hypothetical protein